MHNTRAVELKVLNRIQASLIWLFGYLRLRFSCMSHSRCIAGGGSYWYENIMLVSALLLNVITCCNKLPVINGL